MSVLSTDKTSPSLSPPLKWAGGKRWLSDTLQTLWHQYQRNNSTSSSPASSARLIEPFCGGLSVALNLTPTHALLNDANPYLINFYKQVQQHGLPITEDFKNEETHYYQIRDAFNTAIQSGSALTTDANVCAQWFYYLNRTGYNGLCRFNQQGFYNVPFGRYKTISYANDFMVLQKQLSNWQFQSNSFEQLKNLKETDFIYADPPYDTPFKDYSPGGFSWEQQEQLATWLATHSGPVIASNQATDRILNLYQSHGFSIQLLDAPRRIAANGNRTPAKEMLATRNVLL